MRRSLKGETILIATHNKGKLEEFREIFTPHGVTLTSSGELHLPEPAETDTTFRGNALIKAESACKASGLITIADDSGLCVDALGGAPGVYTADWAGPTRDWMLAMRLVEEKLQAAGAMKPAQRKAQFRATLCVMWPDGAVRYFEGVSPGAMVWPPRGAFGHGYDPAFMPDGSDVVYAEMSHEAKNKISHRGRALEKLIAELF